MNSIKNIIVLLALLWAAFYGMEYLTLWWNPQPVVTKAPVRERTSRIIIGGTGGAPDRIIWEREENN